MHAALRSHGIEVYVVSAAAEELVRMVLSDPRYGYHVKPENVIGVSMLLRDRAQGTVTTARKLITEGRYQPEAPLGHSSRRAVGAAALVRGQAGRHPHPTSTPGRSPCWWWGIRRTATGPYVLPRRRRGAGRAAPVRGPFGRPPGADGRLQAEHAAAQSEHGLPVTADRNWVLVTPDQIA